MTQGTFRRIEDDDDVLGPPSVLVCGFGPDIEGPLQKVLRDVGAREHRILLCSPEMVKQRLRIALEPSDTPSTPAEPGALPRAMVLSGMTGAQITVFLASYRENGLPGSIFASVTPSNLEIPVGQLLVELLRERKAMGRSVHGKSRHPTRRR